MESKEKEDHQRACENLQTKIKGTHMAIFVGSAFSKVKKKKILQEKNSVGFDGSVIIATTSHH